MTRNCASLPANGVAVVIALLAVMPIVIDTASAARVQSSGSVIDRTYSCASGFVGGLRQIEARAHSGSRVRSEWTKLPYAVIASGGSGRTAGVEAPPENSVAWITAGKPSLKTSLDDERLSFKARVGGTIGVNRKLCSPVSSRIPLAAQGLAGGAVGPHAKGFDCDVGRRVLLRIRAVVDGGTELRERWTRFRATNAPAQRARLSVATVGGRVVAFAEVVESGKARLFAAPACTPD